MEKKQFIIQQKKEDGTLGEPEIHRIEDIDFSWRMGRREFLATAALGLAAFSCIKKRAFAEDTITGCSDLALAHGKWAEKISFSPDGSTLISLGYGDAESGEKCIKSWSLEEGVPASRLDHNYVEYIKEIKALSTGSVMINGTRMTDSGTYFAMIGSGDGAIQNKGVLLENMADAGAHFAFNPACSIFTACVGNRIFIVDVATFKSKILVPQKKISSVDRMSLSANYLVYVNYIWQKHIFEYTVINITDMKEYKTRVAEQFELLGIAVKPDESCFVSVSSEYKKNVIGGTFIHMHELPGGRVLKTINGQDYKSFRDITYTPDGKEIAFIDGEGVTVLDADTLSYLGRYYDNTYHVTSFVFDPKGDRIFVAFSDGTIREYDTGSRIQTGCLFDPEVLNGVEAATVYSVKGGKRKLVAKGGADMPGGSVCTCNTVPGRYKPAGGNGRINGGGSYRICTCVPVK